MLCVEDRNLACFVIGPKTWLQRYKVAKGNLQSPINIDTAQVVVGDNVGPIQFQYVDIQNSTITNDGRHLQVTVIKNESGGLRYYLHIFSAQTLDFYGFGCVTSCSLVNC